MGLSKVLREAMACEKTTTASAFGLLHGDGEGGNNEMEGLS